MATKVIPRRPYILRAYYDWMIDNHYTPYIVVNANPDLKGLDIPFEYVNNGRVVFNISPNACDQLLMTNNQVSFLARFNGVILNICIPISALMVIYARETGEGVEFEEEDIEDIEPEEQAKEIAEEKKAEPTKSQQSKSHLRFID